MNPAQRPLLTGLLLVAAAVTSWWVWNLREREMPAPLVGPPRSDYEVDTFELIAFDSEGKEAFSLRGPRLARHPFLGTLDIEQPRMRMPTADGAVWRGRADQGWISRDADLLRLLGKVDLRGPRPPQGEPLRLRSASLDLLPNDNKVRSDDYVTVTGAGSILHGKGLRADLDARQVELLSEVTARYVPIAR